jgi:serine/threonine-protein kinase
VPDFIKELRRRNVFRAGIAYVVIGWLTAQVAELALDSFEAPSWVIKTILLMLALGFPLVLLFAWAYELTPEGLKKEREVDRSQSITGKTGRKLDFVIIGLLSVGLVFVVIDNYVLDGSVPSESENTAELRSIAVLPFVNMSNDPDQDYFSDGISEELLNVLAKIPAFRVAGRTSSFAFKGRNADLRQIGDSLGVETILEGSVRKSGDRVRITAQLIKTDDGFHLWTETDDRKLDDIFAVQDDIASSVVRELKLALLGKIPEVVGGDRGIDDVEAYNAYLQGLFFLNKSGPDNLEKAARYMEQAVELAPDSALAWAGLSRAKADYAGQTSDDPAEDISLAREAAKRALMLDDSLPEVYLAIANYELSFDWNWDSAEKNLNRALELRPGDLNAQLEQSNLLVTRGRLDEARQALQRIIREDPLNYRVQRRLMTVLQYMKEYVEAAQLGERMIEQDPAMPFVRGWLSLVYLRQGRHHKALELALAEPVSFFNLTTVAIMHNALGNHDDALTAQQTLLAEYGDLAAFQQAVIFVYWGDYDKSVEYLERGFEIRDPGMGLVNTPIFDVLKDHPGYRAILSKMNLADSD